MLDQGECGVLSLVSLASCTGFRLVKSFFAGKRSDSKQTSMQSTHMQAHTDSNTTKQTSTDQHADRCMQTLTQ